jgi:hypothetical protein
LDIADIFGGKYREIVEGVEEVEGVEVIFNFSSTTST